MRSIILFISALLLSLQLFAADEPFPGIESLMTAEELAATGLNGLSREQLDALNAWLVHNRDIEPTGSRQSKLETVTRQQADTTQQQTGQQSRQQAPQQPDPRGFRQEEQPIVSRISSEFTGWTGSTRFTLENGQVWQQRRNGNWKISLDRPEVRITKNALGIYEMEVLSEDKSIGVRRIQ